MTTKQPYICGALTELAPEIQEGVKRLYTQLADICMEEIGIRAFVPHEHFDPILHADYTPQDVNAFERSQVCERTSCLVVVAIEPTWGGGIEVEMAHRSGVPVIVLKPEHKKLSRLLLGNPAIHQVVEYSSFQDALSCFREAVRRLGDIGE